MGSFYGHALPGTFFCLVGVWWTFRIFRRYFTSLAQNKDPYVNSATYPPQLSRFPRLNLEALLFTISGCMGIFVEIVAACFMRGMPIGYNNSQHATMYFFFGLFGALCMLLPLARHRILPGLQRDVQYVSLLLAYVAEALLFKFHLEGRDGIDVLVHTLLLYTVYACVLFTALEMYSETNVLASLARAFFTTLQGTWFWQTGFLLYNPLKGHTWETHPEAYEGPHGGMFITLIFVWHIGVVFILTLATGALIGWRCSQSNVILHENVSLLPKSQNGQANGYSVLENNIAEEDL